MVRKLISLFHREISGVHHAAYILGGFALISQLLALVRDRLLASTIGPGEILDAYFAAFRIPDLMYALLASLMSVSVLIPFLAEREGNSSEEKSFMNSVFSSFFIVIIIASAILWFFVPWLVESFIKDEGINSALVISLTRIMLLQPIFLGISNLLASITQSRRRFFLYALSPLVYNISIIFGIAFFAPTYGIVGVTWGVVIGAILHFLIQIPFVSSENMLPRFTHAINWPLIKKIVLISFPRTLAISATMLELVFMTFYASKMMPGSLSLFNLSFNLQSVPLAIVGVSYSLAAFPTLSKLFSQGARDQFVEHIIVPAQHIIFWSLPITAMFIVLRAHIVRVILGAGNFDWNHTKLAAAALALFVLSLITQNLELLFIRGYYAMGKTRIPVLINLLCSVITVAAPYFLLKAFFTQPAFAMYVEKILKVTGVPGTEVLMLPLAFSIGNAINCFLFMYMFERDFKGSTKKLHAPFWRGLLGASVIGITTYGGLAVFENLVPGVTTLNIFLQGFLAGVFGMIVTYAVLKLIKSPELAEVEKALMKKFSGSKIVDVPAGNVGLREVKTDIVLDEQQ